MSIDYFKESEKYRPRKVTTLLVGEAPPAFRKTYFYLPRPLSNKRPVRNDRSLPATIFYHYFQRRPETEAEYVDLLFKLQNKGIFLIDICDEPLRVRGNKKNLEKIVNEIPNLRNKMILRNISIEDEDIIFLLPRKNYLKYLKSEFPTSKYFRWIDFRMSPSFS
ncbi:MAG: hypothetical protein ACUVUQ_04685 [Thermodesulfovibrionales bacterium]